MIVAGKKITFNDITIDFENKKITWKQEEQQLEGERTWALLEMLISKSPMLLSYSEICRILWPEEENPWVDDSRKGSIRVNISWIRKAIHDFENKYIINTSRKGYTFTQQYTVIGDDNTDSSSGSKTPDQIEHMQIKWTDGTIKTVKICRKLVNADQSRRYYIFICDGKYYSVKICKDQNGKDKWEFAKIKDWIDLDTDRRQKELNPQFYALSDSDMTFYDFVSNQKSYIDKIFSDYPQYSTFFSERKDSLPDEHKLEMCLAIATLVANCLFSIEPMLVMLPFLYAKSLLEWRKRILSSEIIQFAVNKNPDLWSFIYK